MDKILKKFYLIMLLSFVTLIHLFSNLFININNLFDLVHTNFSLYFNEASINVNIDKGKPNLIIMFDDGWKSQYDVAYRYMKKKDIRGSISIISSEVGNIKYLNIANIYEIYSSHWDILNHTYSHKKLSTLSYNEQKREIKKSISWFKEKQLDNNLNILIYPEGVYDNNTVKVLKELNFINGRTATTGYNTDIINNPFDIKIKTITANISTNTIINWINYAKEKKLTIILVFHDINNHSDSPMSYKVKNFYKIIDYIDNNRNDFNIITYSDWIRTL